MSNKLQIGNYAQSISVLDSVRCTLRLPIYSQSITIDIGNIHMEYIPLYDSLNSDLYDVNNSRINIKNGEGYSTSYESDYMASQIDSFVTKVLGV